MLKLHKLRDVVFSQLFPTSEMVISMSREFGIPLTYEDFENEKPKTQVQNAGWSVCFACIIRKKTVQSILQISDLLILG